MEETARYNNGLIEDKLHEECGIFGILDPNHNRYDLARTAYFGLFALQHRGQESAGIAVSNGEDILIHKNMGLVSEVFDDSILDKLKGIIATGHVRYSTTGSSTLTNAQPLVVRYYKGSMALSHNGNLINANEIRKRLEESGTIFQTTTDSEVIANLIAREREDLVEDAVKNAIKEIRGSYALVIMTSDKLIGVRDPYGLKPLSIGILDDCYVLSSETCAFDTIGADFVRDVKPGEIVVIDKNGLRSHHINKSPGGKNAICAFEYVYFARPDSILEGVSVHISRFKAGKYLARESPADADLVIGVPDSGIVSAMGYSQESGIPYGLGLIKNRYVGRTFISPSKQIREIEVKIKLNAMKPVIEGKRIVMVDDSIVRGTTSGKIVQMLKDAGAKEVHVRVSSPPIIHSCYYGIDTSSRRELIGATHSIKEIRDHINADSLAYLSLDGLIKSIGISAERLCTACFNGVYPIDVSKESNKYLYEKC
ncbi:MAG TPA: amidophosphoribosyltransferase [Thermoanaerobacterales bacterium]|nr:amidophosphoribosyltransferase [Thermoanaerobacterales bacterium]